MKNHFIVVITSVFIALFFIFGTHSKKDATSNGVLGDIKYSILAPEDFQRLNGTEWVLLDGQPIQENWDLYREVFKKYSRTDVNNPYSELINPQKNNLPDARGVFLRGMNYGRGIDTGNVEGDKKVGYYQFDAFQGHKFPLTQITSEEGKGFDWKFEGGYNDYRKKYISGPIDDGHGTPRVDRETRPRNIVVYIYVKVKN